ncbi:DUF4902 domain-containing protein [Burkholderia thailandensis]|uniref:DUF4902 domain-containing protein n=1 Tax=Burkholderia thailandensis (strain ATCC 700388 / DSM 13276 / CCUG 48851 / CIP 106301 / E264) TaxID=271848 RepID=Q2T542_BURTA|nr:DUF4902 domain-containing protein [Burkholderia thailandensis]ABC36022.1 conserved hypothetical protein [Burkholderia thailandensis E264]AHI75425.1 hypothetical protein BTQ_4798 [Burkholderia thailandensis 2002721723]AHI81215.1 hypothetical protein BTJ_3430 [Burkholderia thailandensis E444]AIC91083.1 hypothetical protein BTRA_4164 [Burkholderia thailandensis USAMRU Malaysia \
MNSPLLHRFRGPSTDGYVRLPVHAFAELQLVHVSSGIDSGLLGELRASDIDARVAGYTEWERPSSTGAAHLTVGWDWYIDGATGAFVIAWGDVRSNLMGIDGNGLDIGMDPTSAALSRRLAQLNWPSAVATAMLRRGDFSHAGPTLQ